MAAEPKKPAAPKKNPFIEPKKADAQKKPAAPKTPVAKEAMTKSEAPAQRPVVKASKDVVQMDLYTIRLQPELIAKLKTLAEKKGVTHAQIARDAVAQYLATVK